MSELVRAAARNNAEWCDIVCRLHGVVGRFHDDAWTVPRRSPPLYPDAVTLSPTATASAILSEIDASPGCSVKTTLAESVPDLPVVGYEDGDSLAAACRHGFAAEGALRVWIT